MNMLEEGVHEQGEDKQLSAGSWIDLDFVKPIKQKL